MSVNTMDVFALRDSVIEEYRRFATSFTTIFADDIRQQVEAIYAEGRFWPEPLIQINPSYRQGATVEALAKSGVLHPRTAEIFRTEEGPLPLWKHQEQAVALASQRESFVVTTGTGSGKSLCYFVPIVSAALEARERGAERRTRAIVIYPMNALANSQLEELDKFVGNVRGDQPVTFGRYTGQEDNERRRFIADHPPDILLTNFMMLELLMTRQDEIDRKVIANCAGLQFLVLDELHTYRGRQGADVALLVRRVRERLAPEKLQCIGTSATMASEGSLEDKSRLVSEVASRLFASPIPDSNVIVETLERVTDASATADSVKPQLGAAIAAGVKGGMADSELRTHPLAIWVETRLGIDWSDIDQRWVRARPRSVAEAAQLLSQEAGRPVDECRTVLRELLLQSSLTERQRTGSEAASPRGFFPFKLHQFISGAGHAYATLEPPGKRVVTVDGQQFLPSAPEKRLYPVHFCRECGQEYHPFKLSAEGTERRFLARDIDDSGPIAADEDDASSDDQGQAAERDLFGFLTLHPPDTEFEFEDKDEHYPETWLDTDADGSARLKASYRKHRARETRVAPDGSVGSGVRAWFIPGRFRFCLRCRTTHATAARDRTRLASLSAEGRSSATTVLVGSVLRWMHSEKSNLAPRTRKILSFTDNRQDAALQAGHFNDFLFVSLVRAGFLGALEAAGPAGLRSEELGAAQQRALGFASPSPELRAEWLQEPELRGFNLQEAETTLRQVLAYRTWFDQRRGWRYTNPNLEQLGLVQVDYEGIDDLAADESLFATAPDVLKLASPSVRAALYREIFDHLRKWMAIKSQVLDPVVTEQLLQRSHARLRTPWGFSSDERPRPARWLFISPPIRRSRGGSTNLRDEDLVVRGGSRSSLGRALRSSKSPSDRTLWPDATTVRKMKAKDFDAVIAALLRAACTHGLASEEPTPFGEATGFRLNDACVRFRLATPGEITGRSTENAFFRDFYASLAATLRQPGHPLFAFEAREHTAQVDGEKRAVREKRFRFGEKEREELSADERHVRDIGETARFLPVLVCSPTMELGVDISALNAVYLRNVPPTPANYAQRSGRAGRSGQAALVLTYCSSQSPHDQYFFQDTRAMVHGAVRPPLLDLANRDLVVSHLSATWLACTEAPLDPSIANCISLGDPARPLDAELRASMGLPRVAAEARPRIQRILGMLAADLAPDQAPWYAGADALTDEVVATALQRFDAAFDRWRDLFTAAEAQRDAARRTMDNYAAPAHEKNAAKSRHAQALDQIELLQRGTSSLSSDFYTYRYLATEGFLPGYNFPRLPLMAYVPATADGRHRQTYLQRPRFLALSEFGPRSLVYHEGRAYRVVRAMLSLGHRATATADAMLPTKAVRICQACGGGHWDDSASTCHACGASLGTAEIVKHVYRIENVATQPAERITANDEERQRQGFDLQTTFEWATREQVLDVRAGDIRDEQGAIASLAYGPGATITRLNKGLRRRKNRTQLGFLMDPVSGYWAKNSDDEDEARDPTDSPRQWIVPSVQDRKNALLLRPGTDASESAHPAVRLAPLATVQHALLRGIEATFQLEEGEILAEPMPTDETRLGFLFYEATEGGAGVLTRLVSEPERMAEVAREALRIMHFDLSQGMPEAASVLADVPDAPCVAACYRCLMSYYNQPDHELLDRRNADARQLLLRLARATLQLAASEPAAPTPADGPLASWLAFAATRGLPAPDAEPLVHDEHLVPLAWRSHYAAALLESNSSLQAWLEGKGLEVVVLGTDPSAWATPTARLAKLLGRPE